MGKIELEGEYSPEGYSNFGTLSTKAVRDLELKDLSMLMKDSFVEEIEQGEIGKFLHNANYDYAFMGIEMFINLIEYPQQIRDGGGDALLLIQAFDGYTEYGKSIDPYCISLRIIPITDENGNEFWECIDVETHYNLHRKDAILWKYN